MKQELFYAVEFGENLHMKRTKHDHYGLHLNQMAVQNMLTSPTHLCDNRRKPLELTKREREKSDASSSHRPYAQTHTRSMCSAVQYSFCILIWTWQAFWSSILNQRAAVRTLNSQNKEERRGHREGTRKKTQENKYKNTKTNKLSYLRENRINQKLKGEFKLWIFNYDNILLHYWFNF